MKIAEKLYYGFEGKHPLSDIMDTDIDDTDLSKESCKKGRPQLVNKKGEVVDYTDIESDESYSYVSSLIKEHHDPFLLAPLFEGISLTEKNPSQAAIDAGNYKKHHMKVDGLDISIENRAGSIRSGVSKTGYEWSSKMNHHYGDIKSTMGADNDPVDVFVNPGETTSPKVFIVNQMKENGKDFDEHKCMLGFNSEAEAKAAYLSNYDKGWKCGEIKEMTMDEFKEWVFNKGKTMKPAERLLERFNEEKNIMFFVYTGKGDNMSQWHFLDKFRSLDKAKNYANKMKGQVVKVDYSKSKQGTITNIPK